MEEKFWAGLWGFLPFSWGCCCSLPQACSSGTLSQASCPSFSHKGVWTPFTPAAQWLYILLLTHTSLLNLLDKCFLLVSRGVFPWEASAGALPLFIGHCLSLNFGLFVSLWPQLSEFLKKVRNLPLVAFFFSCVGASNALSADCIPRGSQSQSINLSLSHC